MLDTFDNPNTKNYYLIRFEIPEFTCLCPLTGQPDFAKFYVDYIPKKKCVELKSLKNYMWSFRDVGAFHEKVTNDIHEELKKLLSPSFIRVSSDFFVRGGISTKIVCEFKEKNLNNKISFEIPKII